MSAAVARFPTYRRLSAIAEFRLDALLASDPDEDGWEKLNSEYEATVDLLAETPEHKFNTKVILDRNRAENWRTTNASRIAHGRDVLMDDKPIAVTDLSFVKDFGNGRISYWDEEPLLRYENVQHLACNYADEFWMYRRTNGHAAAEELLEKIENDLPYYSDRGFWFISILGHPSQWSEVKP